MHFLKQILENFHCWKCLLIFINLMEKIVCSIFKPTQRIDYKILSTYILTFRRRSDSSFVVVLFESAFLEDCSIFDFLMVFLSSTEFESSICFFDSWVRFIVPDPIFFALWRSRFLLTIEMSEEFSFRFLFRLFFERLAVRIELIVCEINPRMHFKVALAVPWILMMCLAKISARVNLLSQIEHSHERLWKKIQKSFRKKLTWMSQINLELELKEGEVKRCWFLNFQRKREMIISVGNLSAINFKMVDLWKWNAKITLESNFIHSSITIEFYRSKNIISRRHPLTLLKNVKVRNHFEQVAIVSQHCHSYRSLL